MTLRITAACLGLTLLVCSVRAAEAAPSEMSAEDLAARLSAWQQDGSSYVRLRLEVKRPSGATMSALQIQVKARRTITATDTLFQILWPKERKGEAILLRKAGERTSGWRFIPPGTVRSLDPSQMKEPLFGSDLSYEDAVDNFFAWKRQTILGNEEVGRVNCQILESKPGKGDRSSYASVRTWVDTRRLVPLRVEKYTASNRLARRIDTTNVVTDDNGRHIPANLTVRGLRKDSVTELDGSRIRHDLVYPDSQFTPEAFKEVAVPRSNSE